jgi:hypothetical protein
MVPALPCKTLTYVTLGQIDETASAEDCSSILEEADDRLGRTTMRMTNAFVTLRMLFPAASEMVKLIGGGI